MRLCLLTRRSQGPHRPASRNGPPWPQLGPRHSAGALPRACAPLCDATRRGGACAGYACRILSWLHHTRTRTHRRAALVAARNHAPAAVQPPPPTPEAAPPPHPGARACVAAFAGEAARRARARRLSVPRREAEPAAAHGARPGGRPANPLSRPASCPAGLGPTRAPPAPPARAHTAMASVHTARQRPGRAALAGSLRTRCAHGAACCWPVQESDARERERARINRPADSPAEPTGARRNLASPGDTRQPRPGSPQALAQLRAAAPWGPPHAAAATAAHGAARCAGLLAAGVPAGCRSPTKSCTNADRLGGAA